MAKNVIQFGNAILSSKAELVLNYKAADVRLAVQGLIDAMHDTQAVGLAASHIGILMRLLIIDLNAAHGSPERPVKCNPLVMINPELVWASSEQEAGWEGSVSLPTVRGFISRATHIKVKYIDVNSGLAKQATYDGFLARIWQHECDQLDGIFFLTKAFKQEILPS